MADSPVGRLGGLTPLQYAATPFMDKIARLGRCGSLVTIPEGFLPGSDIAILSILGYDIYKVYEGRGPLEVAGKGYEMQPYDLALRCNLVTIENGKIANHHGGHLTTREGDTLINFLQQNLGDDRVSFITGLQYRHTLIIRNGNKNIECRPPHDFRGHSWHDCLPRPLINSTTHSADRIYPEESARLISRLIYDSQALLESHPLNLKRKAEGLPPANSIWPWGGGYKPEMPLLSQKFDSIKSGAVISAVNLIKGIGRYAGLDIINVSGATGSPDTNYKGKAAAAIDALRKYDFVFLHIEAPDEASHDGNLDLKIKTIEKIDSLVTRPIFEAIESQKFDFHDTVSIAILPDHPTSVELRTHTSGPVPFAIWHPGIAPDKVSAFDEISCCNGAFKALYLTEFFDHFMNS